MVRRNEQLDTTATSLLIGPCKTKKTVFRNLRVCTTFFFSSELDCRIEHHVAKFVCSCIIIRIMEATLDMWACHRHSNAILKYEYPLRTISACCVIYFDVLHAPMINPQYRHAETCRVYA